MASPAAIWSACVILGLAGGATCSAAAESRDIVSQDLKELRAPGKVEAALWTRRSEGYTLQVVLKVDPFGVMSTGARTNAVEASFVFPEAAGTEGVAVALQVDEEFYIQKLESFRS